MSTFFGYEEEKTKGTDTGLPLTGGTMKGDIDMDFRFLKNLPAPVDNYDAVSKSIMELKIKNIPLTYKTVFNLNVADAVDFFKVEKYSGGGVKWIGGGNNLIAQNDEVKSVSIKKEGATSFLSTNDNVSRSRGMILNCPEAMCCNFSVFVVVRKSGVVPGQYWETIWSNDSGGWKKIIGYKNGVNNVINYGGIDGVDLGSVTVPGNVDLTKKHLLSIHWMITNSHIRVNGVKLPGGAFISDVSQTGYPFNSIFANIRSSSNISLRSKIDIYGIKLVSGYMSDREISSVSRGLQLEYSVA